MTELDVTPISPGQQITAPGFYVMAPATYHADPCMAPSLSASIAWLLCDDAPARVAVKHPRFNPNVLREESESMDIGTVAHDVLLQGINRVRVVQGVDDWRTNAAKDLREKIRKDGNIPLLEKTWLHVRSMAAATRSQLDARTDGKPMFRDGYAELVLVWTEVIGQQEIMCRARLDFLRVGGIDDYKSTRASANPADLSRTVPDGSWPLQMAMYRRGVERLTGERLPMRFCVQEVYEPYLLSVITPGPDLELLGEKQLLFARELWARCLATSSWPGYDKRTAYIGLPEYVEQRWLAREERDAV